MPKSKKERSAQAAVEGHADTISNGITRKKGEEKMPAKTTAKKTTSATTTTTAVPPPALSQSPSEDTNSITSPLQNVVDTLMKKIRNLEKRKLRLVGYQTDRDGGKELNADQQEAVSKMAEVEALQEFSADLLSVCQKQLKVAVKLSKEEQVRQRRDARLTETLRLRQLIELQEILNTVGEQECRKKFEHGIDGAAKLTTKELGYCDKLWEVVAPGLSAEEGDEEADAEKWKNHLDDCAAKVHLVLSSSSKPVVDEISGKELNEIVQRVRQCDLFRQLAGSRPGTPAGGAIGSRPRTPRSPYTQPTLEEEPEENHRSSADIDHGSGTQTQTQLEASAAASTVSSGVRTAVSPPDNVRFVENGVESAASVPSNFDIQFTDSNASAAATNDLMAVHVAPSAGLLMDPTMSGFDAQQQAVAESLMHGATYYYPPVVAAVAAQMQHPELIAAQYLNTYAQQQALEMDAPQPPPPIPMPGYSMGDDVNYDGQTNGQQHEMEQAENGTAVRERKPRQMGPRTPPAHNQQRHQQEDYHNQQQGGFQRGGGIRGRGGGVPRGGGGYYPNQRNNQQPNAYNRGGRGGQPRGGGAPRGGGRWANRGGY